MCRSVTDVHGGSAAVFLSLFSFRIKNRYLLNATFQRKTVFIRECLSVLFLLAHGEAFWIKIDVAEVFIGWRPFIPLSFFLAYVHFLLLQICEEPAINTLYKYGTMLLTPQAVPWR